VSQPNSITRLESSKKYLTDVVQVIEEEKNKIEVACNIFGCKFKINY